MNRAVLLALIVTTLTGGCAGGDADADRNRVPEVPPGSDTAGPPSPATPDMVGDPPMPVPEPADPAAGWTTGIMDVQRGTGVATLVGLRAARHEGFDRIVLDFGADPVPGYHIEYIDRPVRSCGSGEVVPISGDGWLEIRMYPAAAHTEAGRPTITGRIQPMQLPNLRQLSLTCDFEAVVTWVAGVLIPAEYRVYELKSPSRLVVDVRHR